ncbi:hypothetical protein [Micromonospora pallida]|nr:hypothetical protein [Micromonospora pallida]
MTLLGQRDAALVPWYLDWITRFWVRFNENLALVRRTAVVLERAADSAH